MTMSDLRGILDLAQGIAQNKLSVARKYYSQSRGEILRTWQCIGLIWPIDIFRLT